MSTHLLTDAEALVMARILDNVHRRRAERHGAEEAEPGRRDHDDQNPTDRGDDE